MEFVRIIRVGSVAVPVLLLVVMLTASPDFGATWDEDLQQRRGEKIFDYYAGRGGDLVFPDDGAHLYGAPFDVLAVALQRVIHADPYLVRHLLNALVGWVGIAFTGLVAGRLFGRATALLAMVLLVTVPRYFGHSMNNPKDIPFATMATVVLYALCCLSERYPFFTWRSGAGIAVAIGLALNIRPGALLFLVYLGVLLFYRLVQQDLVRVRPMLLTGSWLAGIAVVVLAIGSLFWPWALERPFIGPILGLAQVSKFGWPHSMLFDGRDIHALDPQWDYVPQWTLITMPLVLLAGLALSLLLLGEQSADRSKAIALWAVVLFPIVYVIGVRATMYDEIRHLLFVLPPIAVLASAGWMAALEVRHLRVRSLVLGLLLVGLVPPILFEVREHPNQVVYFNELAGGPAKAYGRYEMDYWGNCLLQALDRVEELAPAELHRVPVSGWPLHILRVDASRHPRLEVTDRAAGVHQFEVVLSRGTKAEVMHLAARKDILARVETRDGALLCAVLPGPAPFVRKAATLPLTLGRR